MKKFLKSFCVVVFVSFVCVFCVNVSQGLQNSENKSENYSTAEVGYSDVKQEKAIYKSKQEVDDYETLLKAIIELVKKDYVEKVDEKKLYEYAMNGILSSLDPHSAYLDKETFNEMKVDMKGEFVGLGIEITKESSLIKVISPIEGTPAYKAGIKAGDYISMINDKSVIELSLTEAVKMMRGKKGEKVKITVLRTGETKPLEFNITRDTVSTSKAVRGKRYGDILYFKINSFMEKTYQDSLKIISSLQKEIGENKVKGIVLDLRGNPGGLLDQSVKISEIFLDYGLDIVSMKGRNGKLLELSKSKNRKPTLKNVPMIVMIDEGSASASEIVAGALQDNKRAIVLGTKSFGKGSVQSIISLESGGAIKMTSARYYTPSGRSIQADGIEPDIIVKRNKVDIVKEGSQFSIKEKDLRGHLKGENEDIVAKSIKENIEKSNSEIENLYKTDYQLARALDLLLGIDVFNKNK